MIELTKQITFEAAHRLPEHDGECARLHGHSWTAQVMFRGDITDLDDDGPKEGMLLDFGTIKGPLKAIRDRTLDHYYLNESLPVYPTSEQIAWWLYQELERKYQDVRPVAVEFLRAVRIEETCTSTATYCPSG